MPWARSALRGSCQCGLGCLLAAAAGLKAATALQLHPHPAASKAARCTHRATRPRQKLARQPARRRRGSWAGSQTQASAGRGTCPAGAGCAPQSPPEPPPCNNLKCIGEEAVSTLVEEACVMALPKSPAVNAGRPLQQRPVPGSPEPSLCSCTAPASACAHLSACTRPPPSSVPCSSSSWESLQKSGRYSRGGHAWK